MGRLFIFSTLMALFSACTTSSSGTEIFPTSTSVPSSLILADFPLSVGTIWKYAAEISYQDPNVYTLTGVWSGSITDTVIDEKMAPEGRIVFTLQEDLQPPPPEGVWRQSRTFDYIVSGNGIFEGSMKVYQWPLLDYWSWEAIAGFGNNMHASYIRAVYTPYGVLKGCYQFLIDNNPDTSIDTFCPGIGFAEHIYRHHGSPQVEHYVLVSYTAGQ
jgi:hypothetical protein